MAQRLARRHSRLFEFRISSSEHSAGLSCYRECHHRLNVEVLA